MDGWTDGCMDVCVCVSVFACVSACVRVFVCLRVYVFVCVLCVSCVCLLVCMWMDFRKRSCTQLRDTSDDNDDMTIDINCESRASASGSLLFIRIHTCRHRTDLYRTVISYIHPLFAYA